MPKFLFYAIQVLSWLIVAPHPAEPFYLPRYDPASQPSHPVITIHGDDWLIQAREATMDSSRLHKDVRSLADLRGLGSSETGNMPKFLFYAIQVLSWLIVAPQPAEPFYLPRYDPASQPSHPVITIHGDDWLAQARGAPIDTSRIQKDERSLADLRGLGSSETGNMPKFLFYAIQVLSWLIVSPQPAEPFYLPRYDPAS